MNGGDSGHLGGSLRGVSVANGMGGLPGIPPGAMGTPGGDAAGLGADCRYRENGVGGPARRLVPGRCRRRPRGHLREPRRRRRWRRLHGGAGGGGGAYCAFWDAEHAAAGGGGGGSSYVKPGATQVTHTDGYQSGNGAIVIQY